MLIPSSNLPRATNATWPYPPNHPTHDSHSAHRGTKREGADDDESHSKRPRVQQQAGHRSELDQLRALRPPGPYGKAAIEQLPVELLHKIHFYNPDNALLAVSKTIYSAMRPERLPAAETARWVVHTAMTHGHMTRDKPFSSFVLGRYYTHSPRMLKAILRELLRLWTEHGDERLVQVLFKHFLRFPPFDPWRHLMQHHLPESFLHYLIHTYPTDPVGMAAAVYAVHITEKPKLLQCGADPRLRPLENDIDRKKIPRRWSDDIGPLVWNPDYLDQTVCQCGWRGKPQAPKPAQKQFVELITGVRKRRLTLAAFRNRQPSLYGFAERLRLHDITLEPFMLPFDGTVGKMPRPSGANPYAGQRVMKKYSGENAARKVAQKALVEEYLEGLFESVM